MTGILVHLADRTAPSPPSGAVVLIGNFDGVHRGHRAVVRDAVTRARALGLPVHVLTFDPHPRAVLGGAPPALLTTLERRAELLAREGVDAVLVQPFDKEFAAFRPERFVKELLVDQLHARVVLVGQGFRFGQKREGDLARLTELGAQHGFAAHAHAVEADAAGPFSSSRAREAVARGNLTAAFEVLGRPHALSGQVGHGKKLGRTIGFPTANVTDIPELSPPDGIYAVVVDRIDGGAPRALAKGVMSIGLRPTIEGAVGRTHEVFLFDFAQDIYDARLRVHLVARQRDELKFDGLPALTEQIARDVVLARGLLSGVAPLAHGAFG